MRKSLIAAFVAIAFLRVTTVFAQDEDPAANARVRIGPLMMNPMVSISNLGIDHNVFNNPPDQSPKQDFTVTVTPSTDIWLHLGPTWVTANLNETISWYQKYADERTANTRYKLGWRVPGSLLSFKINGTYVNARDRPGFEIDTRAARKETELTGSIDFHALSHSYIGVTAGRQQTRFAGDAEYLGTNLQQSLNRISTAVGLTFRHELTTLTSVTFSATRSHDQFEFAPERNTASTSAQTLLTFAPAALIRGGLAVGYTDFQPVGGDLPAYRGMTATADLTYVLLGSTRFALTGGRGVHYSYEVNQPYYVQSGIGGSIAQQIFGPFDVELRTDLQFLAYLDRTGAAVQVADRTDRVTSYGAGIGYHLGTDLRLSFNVDKVNRDTKVVDHQYDNVKFGTALTYGF